MDIVASVNLLQALNPLYIVPIVVVAVCAFVVYAFGFKSPVPPPSFEGLEDDRKASKKRKGNDRNKLNNGKVNTPPLKKKDSVEKQAAAAKKKESIEKQSTTAKKKDSPEKPVATQKKKNDVEAHSRTDLQNFGSEPKKDRLIPDKKNTKKNKTPKEVNYEKLDVINKDDFYGDGWVTSLSKKEKKNRKKNEKEKLDLKIGGKPNEIASKVEDDKDLYLKNVTETAISPKKELKVSAGEVFVEKSADKERGFVSKDRITEHVFEETKFMDINEAKMQPAKLNEIMKADLATKKGQIDVVPVLQDVEKPKAVDAFFDLKLTSAGSGSSSKSKKKKKKSNEVIVDKPSVMEELSFDRPNVLKESVHQDSLMAETPSSTVMTEVYSAQTKNDKTDGMASSPVVKSNVAFDELAGLYEDPSKSKDAKKSKKKARRDH